tara:strand:+ start:381 stop:533 length:153 start_codon:yes stop_codon:yes gene_type:complete
MKIQIYMLKSIGEIFRIKEGRIFFIPLILLLSLVSFIILKQDISDFVETE